VDIRNLPRQIKRILNARVGSESIHGWMSVDSISQTKAVGGEGKVSSDGAQGKLALMESHIFPSEYFSATISLMYHLETSKISAGVSSPMKSFTR